MDGRHLVVFGENAADVLEGQRDGAADCSVAALDDFEFDTDTITFIPQSTTKISGDDIEWFEKFMEMLNDNDDVQNVYHNAEM